MNRLKEKGKELVDRYRYYIIIGTVSFSVVVLISMVVMWSNNKSTSRQQSQVDSGAQITRNKSNYSSYHSLHQRTFVDVEGAVKHPGVYQFSDNMRVDDAINMAGGLNQSADRKHIDLAKKLTDQETVYIPVKGEIKGVPGGSNQGGHSSGSSQNKDGKVNINQADQDRLQSINGIGQKRAEKIVEYRKAHGDFKSVDDLKKISGIGDKFLANIKNSVTV